MKVQSIGKSKKILTDRSTTTEGFITLEILIAFTILILFMSGAILIAFGNRFGTGIDMASFTNQSVAVDSQTNNEAFSLAQKALEDARALSRKDFNSLVSLSPPATPPYTQALTVNDLTQCLKQATSTITWTNSGRPQKIEFLTRLSDIAGALALGGDCVTDPPSGGWNPPRLFARDTINPGKFSSLDALQKIVYLGSDDTVPYLFIADTHSAVFNDTSDQPLIIGGSAIPYTNSFNSSGTVIDKINDIDVFKDNSSGKIYAFVATSSITAQLAVIDVTNIHKPVLVAKRKLKNITSTDSTAWGWRLYYYDGKLYITARETGGPEFHVFDVAGLINNPLNPTPPNPSDDELENKELNTTVNDFVVRDDLAFFADESDARGPLLIYDVSTPITELVNARTTFLNNAGNPNNGANGMSIFLLGNKLYFGREKTTSGPEFYILDASNPRTAINGLTIFEPTGSPNSDPNKEMNKDITDMRVAGKFAFLASYGDSSGGFKVWDISNPKSIQPINLTFNFGNKLSAIDYENDFIYATGGSTPNFQILYSP